MSYDPRKFGALCDMCPLKGNVPVPAESNPGATICMVGEAPGADEVREGRPFVGANGQDLQRALNSARLQRRDLHLTVKGRRVELEDTTKNAATATGQFDIADHRSAAEIAALLHHRNFDPVWKDWDESLLANT